LKISQTDQLELPPRRGELVQWHLTAETPEPTSQLDLVTVLQPYRAAEGPPESPGVEELGVAPTAG